MKTFHNKVPKYTFENYDITNSNLYDINDEILKEYRKTYNKHVNITKNLLGEEIKNGITMFTHVMNRSNNVYSNIRSWLSNNFDEIIILDWNSKDNMSSELNKLNDKRIKYYRVENEDSFIRTHAQNLAFRLAGYDKVLKLDSDIKLNSDFNSKNVLNEGTFIVGDWRCARNDNEKHLHGNILVNLKDFYKINGYNEFIKNYGWEDSDFTIRLLLSGLSHSIFNNDTLYHVPHDEIYRKINMNTVYNSNVETVKHKYCLSHMLQWNQYYKLQDYSFHKETNNYIIFKRDKINENIFNDELYKKSETEAIDTVIGWHLSVDKVNKMTREEKINFLRTK
jgi:predicted glycosyltransferase involved in capsule biosynthesis